MTFFPLRRLLLLGLLLLAWRPAAAADCSARPTAPVAVCATAQGQRTPTRVVLAGGFSIGKLFSGINSRTRIVQACVIFMSIALFIMMRRTH